MSDQELALDEQPVEATSEAAVEPTPEDVAAPEAVAQPELAAVEAESEAEPASAGDEDSDSQTIFNLETRQHLTGKVKNITAFGAFVDLGLPQDGLIHISELSRRKVEKVEDVVTVGQEVEVWVKKVDRKRGRISLTMIKPLARRIRDIEEDEEIEGTVTRLEAFGAFIDVNSERDGLVHISQITHDYIKHPQEALEVGQTVNVKVLKVNRKKRQIDLSIKALLPPPVVEAPPEPEPVKHTSAKKAEPEFSLEEQEPLPTAMAVAFANLQEDTSGSSTASTGLTTKESSRRKREQEELIARLANS